MRGEKARAQPNDGVGGNTMKIAEVLKRLNGISTPIVGINWTPSVDERQVVYKLVQQLADRRLIWPSHGDFHFEKAIRSLESMRGHITEALGALKPEAQSRTLLEQIRLALQLFQTFLEKQYPPGQQRLNQAPLKPGVLNVWATMQKVVGERLVVLSTNHKIALPAVLEYTIVSPGLAVEGEREGHPKL